MSTQLDYDAGAGGVDRCDAAAAHERHLAQDAEPRMVADDRRMAYRPTVLQAAAASVASHHGLRNAISKHCFAPKGRRLPSAIFRCSTKPWNCLAPIPKRSPAKRRCDAKRAEEEQFAQDTLAQTGIGSGIVTSQMLVDNINGMDAELTAQRAAADREWTYGHIVVDEAQELTAMDWRMLIRRCPSRSFTIVGDVAQTSALGGTRSLATYDGTAVRPPQLATQRIDDQLPQSAGSVAARLVISPQRRDSTSPPSMRCVACRIRSSASLWPTTV